MKFPFGQVVITIGCKAHMDSLQANPHHFLQRHISGDWGILDEEDRQRNDEAVVHGSRILSRYQLSDGENIYIITEHDRSYTTIMLCDEY